MDLLEAKNQQPKLKNTIYVKEFHLGNRRTLQFGPCGHVPDFVGTCRFADFGLEAVRNRRIPAPVLETSINVCIYGIMDIYIYGASCLRNSIGTPNFYTSFLVAKP